MYSLWHSIYPGDYGKLPHFAYEECLYRDNNRLVYMWDNETTVADVENRKKRAKTRLLKIQRSESKGEGSHAKTG